MAITIALLLGFNPFSIMMAIAVTQIPIFARLLRGSMLAQRNSDYCGRVAVPRRTGQQNHLRSRAAELGLAGDRPGHARAWPPRSSKRRRCRSSASVTPIAPSRSGAACWPTRRTF
ncbi:MAG: hypothetical protein WKF47_02940 [Geodermatophilaceae bacterium]